MPLSPKLSRLLCAAARAIWFEDEGLDREVWSDVDLGEEADYAAFDSLFDRLRKRCRTNRKSTRLNSSHQIISYAVFCLKKNKRNEASGARASSPDFRPPQRDGPD